MEVASTTDEMVLKNKIKELEKKLNEEKEEKKELKEENNKLKEEKEEKDKKYEKVIKCIKGENSGRCEVGNFLEIDDIPDNIKGSLRDLRININSVFPIDIKIPYKNDEPCNNQSLGNQIPNGLEKKLTENESLCITFKGCGAGYPDRKVFVNGIDTALLWEWKSMYSRDGKGVRVCITKFPNNCIPKHFNDCDEKFHLWVCLDYEKNDDPINKNTIITVTKLTINSISPQTTLNTKFELSTTEDLIKSEIENGNIVEL